MNDNHKEYYPSLENWLEIWDSGKPIWTIEMGGLGPGYEQCIHLMVAEMVRFLLKTKPDFDKLQEDLDWQKFETELDDEIFSIGHIKALGVSGAQYDAALNLAVMLYRHGPNGVLNDERVKDRHIQVSSNFP